MDTKTEPLANRDTILLTPKQVCDLLCISRRTLDGYRSKSYKKPTPAFVRTESGEILYPSNALADFMAQHSQPALRRLLDITASLEETR